MHSLILFLWLDLAILGCMPELSKTERRANRELASRRLNELADELCVKTVTLTDVRERGDSVVPALFERLCKTSGADKLDLIKDARVLWQDNGGCALQEKFLTEAVQRISKEQGKWGNGTEEAGTVPGHCQAQQSFYTKKAFRLNARAFMLTSK